MARLLLRRCSRWEGPLCPFSRFQSFAQARYGNIVESGIKRSSFRFGVIVVEVLRTARTSLWMPTMVPARMVIESFSSFHRDDPLFQRKDPRHQKQIMHAAWRQAKVAGQVTSSIAILVSVSMCCAIPLRREWFQLTRRDTPGNFLSLRRILRSPLAIFARRLRTGGQAPHRSAEKHGSVCGHSRRCVRRVGCTWLR